MAPSYEIAEYPISHFPLFPLGFKQADYTLTGYKNEKPEIHVEDKTQGFTQRCFDYRIPDEVCLKRATLP